VRDAEPGANGDSRNANRTQENCWDLPISFHASLIFHRGFSFLLSALKTVIFCQYFVSMSNAICLKLTRFFNPGLVGQGKQPLKAG
jgi:hypothetical protein